MRRLALYLMVLLVGYSSAIPAGDIVLRTSVTPEQAWVGQRVLLHIDVLGAEGWTKISKIGEVDVPGAYTIRTESQGSRLQKTIDGVSYTGQRYELSIYPQVAGAVEVPAIPVELSTKAWGSDTTEKVQRKKTPAVRIITKLPPGAEEIRGLISTPRLTAEQKWEPFIEAPKVGDAFKRRVILQVEDVSGMAFAPLRHSDIPGVGIYPAEPTVKDASDRGSLTGTRIEVVTYVFERAGVVQIPDIVLTWWNVSAAKLETVNLPGSELEVVAGPPGTSGSMEAAASVRFSLRVLWLPGAILLVAVVLLLRFGRSLGQRWGVRRLRRRESEAHYFRRAVRSVRSKDARLALCDIMRWLDRINEGGAPAQLQAFVRRYADGDAQWIVDQLLRGVATDRRLVDPVPLIKVLTAMRVRWREARRPGPDAPFILPDLNRR